MQTGLRIIVTALALSLTAPVAHAGGDVVTGWFGGQTVNYIDQGLAKDGSKNGASEIYLIGGNRIYQANVLGTVQGEPGFNPHWDLNIVHTAPGITVRQILDSGLASSRFATEGVMFDDARNVLEAQNRGLVRIDEPGLIVLCPVVSDNKTPKAESFLMLTEGSSF